jgi:hypothetical protein
MPLFMTDMPPEPVIGFPEEPPGLTTARSLPDSVRTRVTFSRRLDLCDAETRRL